MNNITILVPTYNRIDLLQKALISCINQSCKDFDLMIMDNHSTDGTQKYLKEFQEMYPKVKIIINSSNIGPTKSVEKALNMIETKWITILCDDDYLEKDFILSSIGILSSTTKGIVAVGHNVVDENGKVIKTFLYPRQTLDRNDGIIKALSGDNTVAGVSGFFFLSDKVIYGKYHKLYDFPRGFLTDTMITMKGIIENNGVEMLDKVLYNRMVWSGNESSFSISNMKLYFEALLQFGHELLKISKLYDMNHLSKHYIKKELSFKSYFFIVLMPLFFKGTMNLEDLKDFKVIVEKNDKRYLKHYYLLILLFPLLTKYTYVLRNSLYKFLKKIK